MMEAKPSYEDLKKRVEELEKAELERQQALEKLRQSQAALERTESAANVGSWEWKIGPDTIAWSEGLLRIFDIDPEERSSSWAELGKFTHPEDTAVLRQLVDKALAEGSPYELKMRIFRRDGEPRICLARGFPEIGPDGKPVRLYGSVQDITENKLAEAALQINKQQYRHLIEHANSVILRLDTRGNITFFNRFARECFGFSENEIRGKNVVGTLLPENEASGGGMRDLIRDIGSRPERYTNREYESIRKDGQPVWIAWSSKALFDRQGEISEILCIGTDITQRKAAEAERDEYEKLLSSSLEAVDSMLMVIDKDLRIVWCNWKDHDWITEEERSKHPYCFQVMKNRKAPKEDCPALKTFADGQHRWFEERQPVDGSFKEISVAPIFDDRGRVKYVLENVRDVTERKSAVKILRLQSQTLNQIEDRITVTDLDGYITYVNDAECRMFGKPREELIGQHITCFGEDPATGASQQEILQSTLRDGSWRGEVTNFREDGTPVILDCRTLIVRDDAGNPVGLCGISTDITDRKREEAEKSRLEAQLNQAQKLESIGRLAGGAAHDLNNLLSPVLGYSDIILAEMETDHPFRESIQQIREAGRRARDLVSQLLAFSRRQSLEFRPIDLNELLQEFENLIRRTIRENITINMELEPSLPPLKGDAGQLEQVILNLAINAQDAMVDGGALSIETAQVEFAPAQEETQESIMPGSYIRLKIQDTGCGMDADTLEHLFEPFFTTKSPEQGTGLGLASVYGIVKQHGGTICVESEPGRGTAFDIYLPAAQRKTSVKSRPTEERHTLEGSETILLVEDNAQMRELAHLMLERRGYNVLSAEDGPAALALLQTKDTAVHLLVTDVIMPEMNGKDLYNRTVRHQPELKVLYISGYSEDVIAHLGVLDEGVWFLQKPFSNDALAAKVREILDG